MQGDRRSWKSLWCDRRKHGEHTRLVILTIASVLMFVSIALAETGTAVDKSDKALFFTLFGIIQVLIGFIYVSGQKQHHDDIRGIREDITELRKDVKALAKEKMDTTEHDKNCPNK